jgi:4-amino-4-deoxy-L-arabinose transferase-like glycosyltransferase
VLSVVLALLFIDPFIGDWDAVDYTVLALRGHPSSMALGRSLFIFFNHFVWRAAHSLFQLPPEEAYLLFKYAVVIQTPLAVIACWRLAREVGATLHVATLASLLVAGSPAFVVYSGQAMTEIPSLLILTVALTLHARGLNTRNVFLVFAGAALLGAGVNVRESVGFYAPWLVFAPFVYGWRLSRRDAGLILISGLIFCLFAIGGFAFWYITDIGSYRAAWDGWRTSMAMESARHPVSLWNVIPFALLLFVSSPLIVAPLPFAFLREWRERGLSRMFLLASVGLLATSLLILNYSTTINWRYFLTGLPAFAPIVAAAYIGWLTAKKQTADRALKLAATVVVVVLAIAVVTLRPFFNRTVAKRIDTKNYLEVLARLPKDAVVIAGAQTVAVTYWRGVGAGEWEIIGTGGGWPGDALVEVIQNYLNAGKPVLLDTNPRLWSPCGWQAQETRELPKLEQHFRFRRLTDTIYQIRTADEKSARDSPQLDRLLPENRTEEAARCLRSE